MVVMQIYDSNLASSSRKEMKCGRDGCCERGAAHISCLKRLWRRLRAVKTFREHEKKKSFRTQIIRSPSSAAGSVSAASLQRLCFEKLEQTSYFSPGYLEIFPSVLWYWGGEPPVPPVRSGHAWTVEVPLAAAVMWSGSLFSCLLSCCCGDKGNEPTSSSSTSVSRSLRNTFSLPNSNLNLHLWIIADLLPSSSRVCVFESDTFVQHFPVLWWSLHDILPVWNVQTRLLNTFTSAVIVTLISFPQEWLLVHLWHHCYEYRCVSCDRPDNL